MSSYPNESCFPLSSNNGDCSVCALNTYSCTGLCAPYIRVVDEVSWYAQVVHVHTGAVTVSDSFRSNEREHRERAATCSAYHERTENGSISFG